MTVVCAWCSRVLGTKPGPAGSVTHGICTDCIEQYFPKESRA